MKILSNTVLATLLMLCTDHIYAKTEIFIEYDPPQCGEMVYDGQTLPKYCMSRDFVAKKIHKPSKFEWGLRSFAGAGHPGSIDSPGNMLSFKDQFIDFNGHIWDYSNQIDAPLYFLKGNHYVLYNAIFFNVRVVVGNYIAPDFKKERQYKRGTTEPETFIYAKSNPLNKDTFNNVSLLNSKIYGDLMFSSWDGIIKNNIIFTKSLMNNLSGSKATVQHNVFYANKIQPTNPSNISIRSKNQTTDFTSDIIDKYSIACVLHVKFSPDTVIDGNTFNLNHQGDAKYAIVLDHSPRVRIINNTFNGFKVPILMDQWSSIVDEKGNVIHPDQFSGDITMNKKGEIVQVK